MRKYIFTHYVSLFKRLLAAQRRITTPRRGVCNTHGGKYTTTIAQNLKLDLSHITYTEMNKNESWVENTKHKTET